MTAQVRGRGLGMGVAAAGRRSVNSTQDRGPRILDGRVTTALSSIAWPSRKSDLTTKHFAAAALSKPPSRSNPSAPPLDQVQRRVDVDLLREVGTGSSEF